MQEIKKLNNKGGVLKIFIIFIILIIILVVGSYFYYNNEISKKGTNNEEISFVIDSGASVYGVGEKLKNEGIINNLMIYKIYVKLNNINEYKAGIYKIKKSLSMEDIIKILKGTGYNDDIVITFKEGITVERIAELVESNTNITKDEFLAKINDTAYLDTLINKYWFLTDDIKNSEIYYPLEGYLYADTYSFRKDANIEEIVSTMLDQTDKKLSNYKDEIEKSSYSVHELVTLASIIEKEGTNKDDRKIISSVFYNRLRNGMSLGSDVTTYYAFKVDMASSDLTNEQINTYNAYNTRGPLMAGKLPIGAICNFNENSFLAAVSPEETNYLYFVADKYGKTHFAESYSEHQKIISDLKSNGDWFEY